ncbi:MAG: hypothetical protein FD179_1754 [Erysipelotrichaceae bacterium]|nr:MAG: hypothetical protein FD179_1754 [Erysipelotrichaceae bacterium]
MENYKTKIDECAAYLKDRIKTSPKIACVLGTGLGNLVNEASDQQIFPYADLNLRLLDIKDNLFLGN